MAAAVTKKSIGCSGDPLDKIGGGGNARLGLGGVFVSGVCQAAQGVGRTSGYWSMSRWMIIGQDGFVVFVVSLLTVTLIAPNVLFIMRLCSWCVDCCTELLGCDVISWSVVSAGRGSSLSGV